jgi:TolB protein
VNDHDVTVVLERLIEPLDDEVGSWDDVLARAAETRGEDRDDALDRVGSAQDRRQALEPSRDRQGRRQHRRRLVALAAAALVVVVGTASAFGTVRDLFMGSGGSGFASPVWSPDGRKIYFLSYRWGRHGHFSPEVHAINADGSGQLNLTREWGLDSWSSPIWSPNGKRLLFENRREGRFVTGLGATTVRDVYTMNVGGTGRRRLARGITRRDGQASTFIDPSPAWSPDGRRIAFVSNRDGWRCPLTPSRHARCDFEIYVMNADGSGQRNLSHRPGIDAAPVWSPDGRSIAFVSTPVADGVPDGPREIYVMNADGSGQRMLARGGAPAWSPDGRRIAFWSLGDGNGEVYVVNGDGSGRRRLTRNPGSDSGPVWSRDGRKIFFVRFRHGESDVWVMNADGSGQRDLSRNQAPPRDGRDSSPVVSPDGRKIAFVSQREGNSQIYVMNADGSGLRRLTPRGP